MTRAVFDPMSPDFVRDPYPIYAQLRANDPVHLSPMGFWVLTAHADVVAAINDDRLSNRPSRFAVTHARNRDKYAAADVAGNIIPFLDPPEHTRARKLISKAFYAHLREHPPDVAGRCDRLLAPLLKQPQFDAIADLGRPLAAGVVAEFLGLPEQDLERLQAWSHWYFYLFSPIPSQEVLDGLNRGLTEFREYLAGVLEQRRQQPADDLISRLMQADDDGAQLSDAEVIDTCMLLFADGVENVDSGFGNCVLAFMEHPDSWEMLRARPELGAALVSESLRLNPPGQFISKIAREDFELQGRKLRKDQAVILVLAAANRDPQVFEDPDDFLPERSKNRHLSFGRGRHACIGAPLVELELVQASQALANCGRRLRLAVDEPQWQARLGHRWLTALPVAWN